MMRLAMLMTAFGLGIHAEPPELFTETMRKHFSTPSGLARDIAPRR